MVTITANSAVITKSDAIHRHATAINEQAASHASATTASITTPPLGFAVGDGHVGKIHGARLDKEGTKSIPAADTIVIANKINVAVN